jgi:hypothetical protein
MGRLISSKQTATWDTISYWIVNLSSAFLLSASHNVLYFVLNIRTPVIHFLHNFNTFILLLICQLVANPRSFGRSASDKLDQKASSLPRFLAVLLPPAVSKYFRNKFHIESFSCCNFSLQPCLRVSIPKIKVEVFTY